MTGTKKTKAGKTTPSSKVSGQGSGGGGEGGGVEIDVADTCKAFKQQTPVIGPNAAVLAKVSAGSMLTVALDTTNGVEAIVIYSGKEKLGSITPKDQNILVGCLKKGYEYVAFVKSKLGAGCQVTVQRQP